MRQHRHQTGAQASAIETFLSMDAPDDRDKAEQEAKQKARLEALRVCGGPRGFRAVSLRFMRRVRAPHVPCMVLRVRKAVAGRDSARGLQRDDVAEG